MRMSLRSFAIVTVLALTSLLSGCAEVQVVKTAVATNGAKGADSALEVAEWGVCEATTMGAWQRRYGTQVDKVDGWKKLCSKSVTAPDTSGK